MDSNCKSNHPSSSNNGFYYPRPDSLLIILLFIFFSQLTLSIHSQTICRIIPPHLYPNYPIHPDCGLGEYCSENLQQCVLLDQHPKWGVNCSTNILLSKWVCSEDKPLITAKVEDESNSQTFLNGDLECIHHKCLQCEE